MNSHSYRSPYPYLGYDNSYRGKEDERFGFIVPFLTGAALTYAIGATRPYYPYPYPQPYPIPQPYPMPQPYPQPYPIPQPYPVYPPFYRSRRPYYRPRW